MMLSVVSPPARHLRKPESRTLIESRIRTSGCMGPLASPPQPPPTWLWVSTRPGMITLPAASIRSASAGIGVVAAGPTAVIFPLATTTTPAGIGGPETGSTSAPMKATGRSWATAGPAAQAAANAKNVATQAKHRRRAGVIVPGSIAAATAGGSGSTHGVFMPGFPSRRGHRRR